MTKAFNLILCLTIFCFTQAQVTVNRYSESRVSPKGLYGKKDLDKEIIIPEINVKKTLEKWERENTHLKFAEPVLIDISPLTQGTLEKSGDYNVYRIKISAKGSNTIAISFDQLFLNENSELFIYNDSGTIITGPVTSKENISGEKSWSSNVFPGSSIIVEVKIKASEESLNRLHINKVLYGLKRDNLNKGAVVDSTTGPGFGLSSICNMNVVCYSGWDQESKGIAQVVDGGGGWYTAFLVMNTCSTQRPYLLTAWHCIVQNGSVVNPSNSTFEFLWISPTCNPTTNTASTLLFNGATLRSLWEQTDFALLELNQSIPQNSGINFLGWSRSSNIPNGAVSLHHPMGDIMKISVENDLATIGNIKTYQNMAWRVQWDLGVQEHGSSGSPLFNMSHQVVGQLYSNTQPTSTPCSPPTGGANHGRFDLSWNGGGTSGTRLSDWLDPSGSNFTSTNTTNVAQLMPNPAVMQISGTDLFCSGTQTYNLIGAPSGATIAWDAQPQGYATITPNGTSCSVTMNSAGAITLKASLLYANCNTVTKVVHMGVYGSGDYPVSGPSSAGCGAYVTYTTNQLPGATNYTWFYPSSWTYVDGQGTYMLTLMTSYSSSYGQIGVRVANTCGAGGSYAIKTTSVSGCYGYFAYSVSPNPSTSDVTVTPTTLVSSGAKQKSITEINIYDAQNNLKKHQVFNKVSKASINVSGLPMGIYVIEIINGTYKEKQKLSIVK